MEKPAVCENWYIVEMEVKVRIPEEFAKLAKARGVRVEEYVEELLSRQAGNGGSEGKRPRSAEEI